MGPPRVPGKVHGNQRRRRTHATAAAPAACSVTFGTAAAADGSNRAHGAGRRVHAATRRGATIVPRRDANGSIAWRVSRCRSSPRSSLRRTRRHRRRRCRHRLGHCRRDRGQRQLGCPTRRQLGCPTRRQLGCPTRRQLGCPPPQSTAAAPRRERSLRRSPREQLGLATDWHGCWCWRRCRHAAARGPARHGAARRFVNTGHERAPLLRLHRRSCPPGRDCSD